MAMSAQANPIVFKSAHETEAKFAVSVKTVAKPVLQKVDEDF
jgi:hypothetical protein